MSQSQAIIAKRDHAATLSDLLVQIQRLRQARDNLATQLAQIEGSTTAADAEHQAANAALSAAITQQALGDGSAATVDAARARANRAAVALASMASQRAEAEALKASISVVDTQSAPLAQRLQELHAQANELAGQRLRELAADLYTRQRALVETLAALVAEGRALHAVAQSVGVTGNFATPYLFAPTVIVDALGGGDRIVIDLERLVKPAINTLVTTLQSEGFNT